MRSIHITLLAVATSAALGLSCSAPQTPESAVPNTESPTGSTTGSTAGSTAGSTTDQRLINLRAFARLYGYIKYFHPSDEASDIDWNRFAMYGAGRVLQAKDSAQLASSLDELFAPIAPTVQVLEGDARPAEVAALAPASTDGLTTVAWQHQGLGFEAFNTRTYQSIRIGRVRAGADDSGTVSQEIPAEKLRGKRVRFSAWVRTSIADTPDSEASAGRADVFIRARKMYYRPGFSADYSKQPIRGSEWHGYRVEGTVDSDAEVLVVGFRLFGAGAAWFDRVSLEVADGDGWRPHPLHEPGLEVSLEDSEWWQYRGRYFDASSETEGAREGRVAVRIATKDMTHFKLFDGYPKVGEVAEVNLGDGLRAVVPLALWSRNGHTLGEARAPLAPLKALLDALKAAPGSELGAEDERVRLAAVIIAWNAMQHFHPYMEELQSYWRTEGRGDWHHALDRALYKALRDRSPAELRVTLQGMSAHLRDGHSQVTHAKLGRYSGRLPFDLREIEGVPVVSKSHHPDLAKGEVIISWQGRPIAEVIAERTAQWSGSSAHSRLLAHATLPGGQFGESVTFETETPTGERRQLTLQRAESKRSSDDLSRPVQALQDGVYLIDLRVATESDIRAQIDAIAAAPGVIFDLRGYPRSGTEFVGHLLTTPDEAKWIFKPRITYPDGQKRQWREGGWSVAPRKPHISGKVVFMTDQNAISFSESLLTYVVGYKLGEIVGSPTSGANGDYNAVELPGGFRFSFTGQRALFMDRTSFYGRGIQPTVPVAPTLAGFRAGRDEVLERAMEVVRAR